MLMHAGVAQENLCVSSCLMHAGNQQDGIELSNGGLNNAADLRVKQFMHLKTCQLR